jgi:hypothetical protein
MRKSCVQVVCRTGIFPENHPTLSTPSPILLQDQGINHRFSPTVVHNFGMQLYPHKVAQLSGVHAQLSTLSTPLIIKTTPERKENNSLGTGG